MSQSMCLPDPTGAILDGIVEALTSAPSMPPQRREVVGRMVRAMVLGLFPRDVMQLMVAGKAVLFHALTLDAVSDVKRDDASTMKSRARSSVINLSRTMSRNLETLIRLQTRTAKTKPAPSAGLDAFEETIMTEPESDAVATIISQSDTEETPFVSPLATAHPTTAGHTEAPRPLNREQRRRLEREQARLARRKPTDKTVANEARSRSVPGQ